MTSDTVHLLPDDRAVVDLLDVTCPSCDATPGRDCLDEQPHVERVELADELAPSAPDPAGGAEGDAGLHRAA